jgi:hypothetical protein
MEDLREKVYECTLAVEAHMICDLLARAGISARVDGEFLAGAGGERILRPYRRDPACAHGIQRSTDVYDEAGLRIVARQHFNAAWNDSTEFDDDGDGTFERRVEYDRYGVPRAQ